jgi:MraZ protein
MLLGEHRQAINSKGLLVIPEKVLTELDGDLVVTRGFERNLLLFREREWRKLAEKLLAEPMSNREVRDLRRRFFSAAEVMLPDANGRVTLPASLREFAGINGEVILAGMFDYFELWSVEQWLPLKESVEANSDGGRWDKIGV